MAVMAKGVVASYWPLHKLSHRPTTLEARMKLPYFGGVYRHFWQFLVKIVFVGNGFILREKTRETANERSFR